MAERTRSDNINNNIQAVESINKNTLEAIRLIPEYLQRPELGQIINNTVELVRAKGFNSSGAAEYADLQTAAADIAREIVSRVEANSEGPVDLELIVEKLRFELIYQADSQMNGFDKLIVLINNSLKSPKREDSEAKFTSTWVQRNSITTYRHIVRLYRDNSDEVNWQFIAEKLGVSDIFEQNRKRDWANPETIAKEIKLLELSLTAELESDPESFVFNSEAIRRHNSRLHDAIGRIRRDKHTGNIDWDSLIAQMSPSWQERWKEKRTSLEINNYIAIIREELEKSQPANFNPTWIYRKHRVAYNNIIGHYRMIGEEGKDEVDWQAFLQDLGGVWHERFFKSKKISLEDLVPEKQYEKPDEVKQVEDRFDGSYYLASIIVNSGNLSEQSMQNEIFERLIELAQAGNKSAEQRILDHIQDLTAEWSDNLRNEVRVRLQFIDTDELTRMYKECIYLYDQYRDRYPFLALVFGRLNRLLRQQNQFAFSRSFDEPSGQNGEGINYSEKIADPNSSHFGI